MAFKRGFALLPLLSLFAALAPAEEAGPIRFRNVARSAGVDFVLDNYATPEKHMIEMMTGGVATFDYDGDGWTDIYFVNGAAIPSLEKESPKLHNRLYRNKGGMKFEDVTDRAGVAGAGYSMGVATGDYDNDGDVDLFIAGVYRNILYRNNGDGTFAEVTAKAGIKSDMWSVAAGWFDYDNDGLLDLFVVNYGEWTPEWDRYCGDKVRGIRVYCHPKYFTPMPNQLYHNRGDGTFEDVSEPAGIAPHHGRAMGIAFADYDDDGFRDAFVTNDNLPNFLFHNLGDGTFEETALFAGTALLNHGKAVASMGTDFRDYDNDGRDDISVVALTGETFPLFRNLGRGMFEDATYSSRLASLSVSSGGWGVGFFDLDNDGWKDLFTSNSHANDRVSMFEVSQYEQPNCVFANAGDGTFRDVSASVGEQFLKPGAHRGSAFADFNHDGRIDVVVSLIGEPAELWENVSETANNWLILKLTGVKSNRDGNGARIIIGDQHNHMTTSVSYASSSQFGVHFGVGDAQTIERIYIRWPSGAEQVLEGVKPNRVIEVKEGSAGEVTLKAR